MYIPDPIEIINNNIDRLAYEWELFQKGVPQGSFRCPNCKQIRNYEPIELSSAPDSPVTCYDCLPDEAKQMYDQFFER